MKPSERDELLGRLDERTRNTYRLVEKQEKHLERINNKVEEHTIAIARQDERNRPSKKTLSGYGAMVAALVVALWKAFTG